MKIYTKTGDLGETSLYGGKRISKSHLRIDAYGTVDELNSHIGLVRDFCEEETDKQFLLGVQHILFNVGANLASNPEKEKSKMVEAITTSDIEDVEKEIDKLNETLESLKYFILPGGHPHISQTHIARCVCRRSERICVALSQVEPVDKEVIIYLNRLSDYLFTLSRKMAKYLQIVELKWNAKE